MRLVECLDCGSAKITERNISKPVHGNKVAAKSPQSDTFGQVIKRL